MWRLKGDKVVNVALDSALEREKEWSWKSSTISKCDEIFQEISESNHIPNETNCVNVACSLSAELPKIKEAVKKTIANEYADYYDSKVNELMMQGDFLKMLSQEEEDITWKSLIFSVPRGVLSFGIRAATNSLATNDNLVRWGKKDDVQMSSLPSNRLSSACDFGV